MGSLMVTSAADTGYRRSISVQDPLDRFLADVEARAYRTAFFTTKKSADALDIVQDAMTQLVQSYREKDAKEWPLLFQRILQNKMMDWHRTNTKQRRWFSTVSVSLDDDETDFFDEVVDQHGDNPLEVMERVQEVTRVMAALEQLSLRQRQAFLLRAWEGFDVAETAAAMACSEGSVKTHYFRALQAMRQHLLENF